MDKNDTEDFDWEAAVREIDSAFQQQHLPSSSTAPLNQNDLGRPITVISAPNRAKPVGGARQLKLDGFLERKTIPFEDGGFGGGDGGGHEGRVGVDIDMEAAKTWIYPVNIPLRQYQLSIAKTSLFSNTLVALPTGLGKTLIAAVVMYNYFRWFPEGKIVFSAPSRPLVIQQIEACHNIVGISQEWTIDMTGLLNPSKRACHWKTKKIFFVTPQVFEKDIQSGICLANQLVCLVIDEAHRAMGNYSYCVAVRELLAMQLQLRILALTATPGYESDREHLKILELPVIRFSAKHRTIQNVIDNLNISTLEYRDETDHDVSQYVQNRKVELIEVPMGNEAVEINNLLLEVAHSLAKRPCMIGVLYNRDFMTVLARPRLFAQNQQLINLVDQLSDLGPSFTYIRQCLELGSVYNRAGQAMLSPCELLNARDKFRQAPPQSLLQTKYGEVEGIFASLITLCHIRKLLSSHGIKPAYEMLEEKLKQGTFARCMFKIEKIWNAKSIMEKSLSHGAPNPKLMKMMEILTDHFKTKDPRDSRVIIFSNFRGSVKDIMHSLSRIEGSIKATEFIGQSSGKSSKGQTQKVQQAVLQKFRAGGYNVIVATSIGEEGLDIMEVDLVICFDANISPLRMIQRMGRTGRKNDGRVVVLACEGTELKGYLKKQGNSKTMRKLMHNGGIKSFDFHTSPRMVPHACKPEVEFVKLSIGQFVHRGRKVKDDQVQRSTVVEKLSSTERILITRYFHSPEEVLWKPSLVAFPHFQAFPSRVYNIRHSFRTTEMLIDVMQCLRGLSNLKSYKAFHVEGRTSSSQSLEVISAAEDTNCPKDSDCFQDAPKSLFGGELPFFNESPRVTAGGKDRDWESDFYSRMPPVQRFLFESEFISLNSGNVTIAFEPTLPLTKDPDFKTTVKNAMPSINMNTSTDPFISVEIKHCEKLSVQAESRLELVDSSGLRCMENACVSASRLPIPDVHQGKTLSQTNEVILRTSVPKPFVLISENSADDEVLADSDKEHRPSLACGAEDNFSPRLTSFIEEGVVPESPIVNISSLSPRVEHLVFLSPTSEHDEYGLHVKCAANMQGNNNSNDLGKSGKLSDIHGNIQSLALANVSDCNPKLDIDPSLTKSNLLEIEKAGIQGPGCLMDFIKGIDLSSPSNVEVRTPLTNQMNKNSGEDWPPNPCEMSNSIKQERKYRRLCKLRDINKKKPYKALEEEFIRNGRNTCEPIIRTVSGPSSGPGKKKVTSNVKVFIEEEVEVSASAEASEDEEDGNDDDAYDDSFIDDHTNPSVGSTQAAVGGHDMMAIYRRSLLSQSPAITLPHRTLSPKTAESGGSPTEMINNSLQTPRTSLQSDHLCTDRNSISCKLVTAETGNLLKENDQKLEIRKRKLNFQPVGSFYSIKIQREHKLQSEADITTSETHQLEQVEPSIDAVFDDTFYEHLDLDEVEAQATKLLKSKLSMEKNPRTIPNHTNQIKNDMSLNLPGSPSFDLGIKEF